MKKLITSALIATLLLSGCGKPLQVANKEYPTYGLFNSNTHQSDNMCYEVSVGNVIWSIILVETLVAPIYFIGFSIFNPIKPKNPDGSCKFV